MRTGGGKGREVGVEKKKRTGNGMLQGVPASFAACMVAPRNIIYVSGDTQSVQRAPMELYANHIIIIK